MHLKILFSFFFIVGIVQGYSQPSLIGSWRRVDPNLKLQDTSNKKLKSVDLEIRIDSTFHIEGDSVTNSNVAGWNVRQAFNGKWKLSGKNALTFWLNFVEDKIPVNYLIIELAENKLVLRSFLNRDDKSHDITYLRLL